jgi:hypothetical protein
MYLVYFFYTYPKIVKALQMKNSGNLIDIYLYVGAAIVVIILLSTVYVLLGDQPARKF